MLCVALFGVEPGPGAGTWTSWTLGWRSGVREGECRVTKTDLYFLKIVSIDLNLCHSSLSKNFRKVHRRHCNYTNA